MHDENKKGRSFADIIRFILQEMKPRGKFLTPFNVISIVVIIAGVIILTVRFIYGLGSVSNLNQEYPWGLWKGFNVITGVAFAGGAYVLTFVVYVMGVEKYHSIVRVTVLNGLLAYIFYAGALILDLGRPWNIINPIIGNDFGYNSVLFLVAWHFMLYMIAEFIEFSPVAAEWLNLEKAKKVLQMLTLGAVIFGITLSSLHQSGLGALFLMAKSKIHPLWYTEFIPLLFLVSSIFAGISMVIFEGTISHRVFREQIGPDGKSSFDQIVFGLAKGAAIAMFVYYFFKLLVFIHEHHWQHIHGFWGFWYLFEIIGLVLVPCFLFAYGARHRIIGVIRIAAILTLIGIIVNRLNISMIAYNWNVVDRYYPSWMEYVVSFTVIFAEIWVFRWIVTRMPVYEKHTKPAMA
ncbi:MAG: polysulfide reductase NrfD [Deferribacteres bacterium]|nr:polysulfide reductase NrfD [candidate division KSB1 bacterium]MCB9511080.1 polysulfide reductase NrfD [Deferribacteres bacterium]